MVATIFPPLDLEELNVETEALELAHENVERFGQARRLRHVPLHDRLVNLAPALHIVALDGQQLLQRIGGAVGLQGPDLHLAETLTAELRLAAQRLLGDEGVRSDRTGVNLVVDQMRKLEHVDVTHPHLLLEDLAGHTVEQRRLAGRRQLGLLEQVLDVGLAGAVEHRRRELEAENLAGPPEVGLQDLADVHTAGNAQRIQHDLDGRAVRHVGQILLRQDAGDDALVTVAAGHLVAHLQLALHGDVDLDQLDDAGGQLVALLEEPDALLVDPVQDLDVRVRLLVDDLHGVDQPPLVEGQAEDLLPGEPLEHGERDRLARLEQLLAGTRLDRPRDLLADQ